MFIWTCIIGKVDLMFRKYAAEMLFRIEVIVQLGSFLCATGASKTVTVSTVVLLHLDKVPPEDRKTGHLPEWTLGLFLSLCIPWHAKLFHWKTCREKYHGINFSNNF